MTMMLKIIVLPSQLWHLEYICRHSYCFVMTFQLSFEVSHSYILWWKHSLLCFSVPLLFNWSIPHMEWHKPLHIYVPFRSLSELKKFGICNDELFFFYNNPTLFCAFRWYLQKEMNCLGFVLLLQFVILWSYAPSSLVWGFLWFNLGFL